MGTFLGAQTCPKLGDTFEKGGVVWQSESQRISVCSPQDIDVTPVAIDGTNLWTQDRWKRATTTYYQEPGSCVFYAYRTVTEFSKDGITWVSPDYPINEFRKEDTWFTGIITDNGTKISMQAQPGPNNPPYIVYGDITKLNKITKAANKISFTSHTFLGAMAGQPPKIDKCAYTSWGTSTRIRD
jgi:hypothetical protein